jgi:hypothetical protein
LAFTVFCGKAERKREREGRKERGGRERKQVEFHYSNMLIGKVFWYFL